MQQNEREKLRRSLDEALLPFRLVGRHRGIGDGWLRSIRQAVGVPVDEVARRLGVCRWEVHRLEESERNSRIMLATLSRAAKGLGCELVYALIPKERTLDEMAAAQIALRSEAVTLKRVARAKEKQKEKTPWLDEIGWRPKFMRALRTVLRRERFRVRPRKTNRGVEKQMAEFKDASRLVGMASKMGPIMKELAEKKAEKP